MRCGLDWNDECNNEDIKLKIYSRNLLFLTLINMIGRLKISVDSEGF